jgi:hypothetical protein
MIPLLADLTIFLSKNTKNTKNKILKGFYDKKIIFSSGESE